MGTIITEKGTLMLYEFAKTYSSQIASFQLLLMIVNVLLHIIFAGAVARDAGALTKTGQKTLLVSGLTWAFSSLLGGVFVAAIYWFIHHSKLTRI